MRTNVVAASLVALLAVLPRAGAAQGVSLARVDSLLKIGDATQARTLLEQWRNENRADASAANEARALYLSARLASRADSAEDYYLAVALSHATSPYAAESLLRLGQARMVQGDAKQAIVYLRRLLADYPRSEQRGLGAVWLARAQLASGPAQAACVTIRNVLQRDTPDGETAALLRDMEQTACMVAPSPVRASAPAVTGRYTIQMGAFRQRTGAQAYKREIEKAGFSDVRLALMPENSLYRVRVGQYESTAVAQTTVIKLKAAGFVGIVVADRQREKTIVD